MQAWHSCSRLKQNPSSVRHYETPPRMPPVNVMRRPSKDGPHRIAWSNGGKIMQKAASRCSAGRATEGISNHRWLKGSLIGGRAVCTSEIAQARRSTDRLPMRLRCEAGERRRLKSPPGMHRGPSSATPPGQRAMAFTIRTPLIGQRLRVRDDAVLRCAVHPRAAHQNLSILTF